MCGPDLVELTNGLITGCEALMRTSGRTTIPYHETKFQVVSKRIGDCSSVVECGSHGMQDVPGSSLGNSNHLYSDWPYPDSQSVEGLEGQTRAT